MQQPETKTEERLGRIEVVVTRLEPQVARIEERLGKIEVTVGRLEPQVARIDERLGRIEVTVARLEPQVAHIASDVTELKGVVKAMDAKFEKRFEALETKLEAQSAKIDQNALNAEMRFAKQSDLQELIKESKTFAKDSDLKELVKECKTFAKDADLKALIKEVHAAKIWALFIAATILGVLARGFHWI